MKLLVILFTISTVTHATDIQQMSQPIQSPSSNVRSLLIRPQLINQSSLYFDAVEASVTGTCKLTSARYTGIFTKRCLATSDNTGCLLDGQNVGTTSNVCKFTPDQATAPRPQRSLVRRICSAMNPLGSCMRAQPEAPIQLQDPIVSPLRGSGSPRVAPAMPPTAPMVQQAETQEPAKEFAITIPRGVEIDVDITIEPHLGALLGTLNLNYVRALNVGSVKTISTKLAYRASSPRSNSPVSEVFGRSTHAALAPGEFQFENVTTNHMQTNMLSNDALINWALKDAVLPLFVLPQDADGYQTQVALEENRKLAITLRKLGSLWEVSVSHPNNYWNAKLMMGDDFLPTGKIDVQLAGSSDHEAPTNVNIDKDKIKLEQGGMTIQYNLKETDDVSLDVSWGGNSPNTAASSGLSVKMKSDNTVQIKQGCRKVPEPLRVGDLVEISGNHGKIGKLQRWLDDKQMWIVEYLTGEAGEFKWSEEHLQVIEGDMNRVLDQFIAFETPQLAGAGSGRHQKSVCNVVSINLAAGTTKIVPV